MLKISEEHTENKLKYANYILENMLKNYLKIFLCSRSQNVVHLRSCYLNNCFNFHVRLSFRPSVFRPPSVRNFFSISASVSQNVNYKSCLVCVKSEKYASWFTLRPQWDRCRRGEAEVRILDFKTTWSEFHMSSQTAPAEAKPRCVYSI